tara:strand:+ start:11060 stop:11302 length:243 start_codon:yes stop_codon:yes gene_type:complete
MLFWLIYGAGCVTMFVIGCFITYTQHQRQDIDLEDLCIFALAVLAGWVSVLYIIIIFYQRFSDKIIIKKKTTKGGGTGPY